MTSADIKDKILSLVEGWSHEANTSSYYEIEKQCEELANEIYEKMQLQCLNHLI